MLIVFEYGFWPKGHDEHFVICLDSICLWGRTSFKMFYLFLGCLGFWSKKIRLIIPFILWFGFGCVFDRQLLFILGSPIVIFILNILIPFSVGLFGLEVFARELESMLIVLELVFVGFFVTPIVSVCLDFCDLLRSFLCVEFFL